MSAGAKIFRALLFPLRRLPLRFHYAAGGFISWVMKSVLGYRKEVIVMNLSRSFPEKKWKELKPLVNDFYRHFGDILAEAIWFGGCGSIERLRKSGLCTITNPEVLQKAFDEGNSVMVMTSHLGNWELIGGLFAYLPEDTPLKLENIVVVHKKLSSAFWDEFMAQNRISVLDREYNGYIESSRILRYTIAHKDEKKVYFFLADQFPYARSGRHEVPDFMHQHTLTMTGGAALASKLGMSVLYYAMNRSERGKYEITFKEICDNASGMDPAAIMSDYYKLLEQDIVADPGNYLWSHNRWK